MNQEISKAPNLREMCRKYDIRFKKALGQNLLLDDNINRIMVDAAGLSDKDCVVEVGAGLGALTRRLCQQAGRVFSVEIDASFIPCLEDQFGDLKHFRLFRGDALNHPPDKLLNEFVPEYKDYNCKLVANLPYYITTPLLFHFLESRVFFSRLVVMVQDEVGQRMVAEVGSSNYGVLSVAARLYAKVDIVHRVPASCFLPKPKVDSCIVRFRCHDESAVSAEETAFTMKLVRAAFGQRRKTLRNSLIKSGNYGAPAEAVLEAMEETGIDAGRRPQTLTFEEFSSLAMAVRRRL